MLKILEITNKYYEKVIKIRISEKGKIIRILSPYFVQSYFVSYKEESFLSEQIDIKLLKGF
jgi:3-dehydroquinate dehydratase